MGHGLWSKSKFLLWETRTETQNPLLMCFEQNPLERGTIAETVFDVKIDLAKTFFSCPFTVEVMWLPP